MSSPEVAADVRRELEALRADLLARNEELSITSDDPLAYDDNFADSAQVAAELGENQALLAANQEQLDDIDHALAKIEAGTYGTCDVCGAQIGAARLEAMPATRYCIDHA
jgi:RNA polymerase-binding transcription factor DksA